MDRAIGGAGLLAPWDAVPGALRGELRRLEKAEMESIADALRAAYMEQYTARTGLATYEPAPRLSRACFFVACLVRHRGLNPALARSYVEQIMGLYQGATEEAESMLDLVVATATCAVL